MWVVNVILIFSAIAVLGWLLWNYRQQLTNAFGVLVSGCESLIFATGFILVEAVKAAVIASVVGGIFGLIFFVAKAPHSTTKAAAISIATLVFALLVLKAMWENFNNLRWSIRHEIRNRSRRR
ncbi:MAG: hypothetical protein KME25_31845 [Symplocastrum torsivum CPER-KK1]|jgi:energy-coupling factor transporter transmembrane protein EcfT|uniref:Uncharacterized protein n=1 Tax=Symplocastrum torsivum CPER-KK1 TaxID=450513 RepID=A0A951PS62_9CYAN|nr:hypothetical protein [Symplocastrum torsivum CPER-KK1]